jgi:hypothetical protein
LTVTPETGRDCDAFVVDWQPVTLGTCRSYTCTITGDIAHPLTATVEQDIYRRTFNGTGTVTASAIPPAPEGTAGTLTIRNETTGATATYSWRWHRIHTAGAPSPSGPAPAASKPSGLFGRLFGRGKVVASPPAVPTALPKTARATSVAERLGDRAAQAVALTFFGQETVGQRFAFILDRSGSMEGSRWAACTRQLERVLRSLPPHVEFMVILFSSMMSEPTVATREGWLRAERAKVDAVIAWVGRLGPAGGTYPAEAFQRVFSLATPPDVVYFLTDGKLSQFNALDFERLLGDKPTVVNTIALEGEADTGVLQEIAVASGGQFIQIPNAAAGGF